MNRDTGRDYEPVAGSLPAMPECAVQLLTEPQAAARSVGELADCGASAVSNRSTRRNDSDTNNEMVVAP